MHEGPIETPRRSRYGLTRFPLHIHIQPPWVSPTMVSPLFLQLWIFLANGDNILYSILEVFNFRRVFLTNLNYDVLWFQGTPKWNYHTSTSGSLRNFGWFDENTESGKIHSLQYAISLTSSISSKCWSMSSSASRLSLSRPLSQLLQVNIPIIISRYLYC